ncbi:sensor histidine kinase [Streptomyces sp. 4N509B]|uniref:sensor histidine kinase n=1 Tax=Streptomyces sp. 4N509B TaxID=3457413 RepID=UPI003FD5FB82
MPYFLLLFVTLGIAFPESATTTNVLWQLAAYALALPLVALTGLLLPLVRPLEAEAVRALCGVPAERLATGPARSWAARRRAAVWFTAHLGIGGLLSGVLLAVPPMVAVLLALPFSAGVRGSRFGGQLGALTEHAWLAPAAGLALLAALVAVLSAGAALLARVAPALLGPTPADRLAAAEARAADLAARHRLARELHDSVGHALSAVSLQAAAARRVLAADTDPAFVREALAAIEETARGAVGELDTVLGLLREEEPAARAPTPTLDGLDALVERTRAAGLTVTLTDTTAGRAAAAPGIVSREAYRIIQEGLTNALRHTGPVAVTVRLGIDDEGLTIAMENPLRSPTSPSRGGRPGPSRSDPSARRPGGGRGLRGVAERAALLGGGAEWGAAGDRWRLLVRLPLGGGAS